MRMSPVTSLTAGRWFCGATPPRLVPNHHPRREFSEHPSLAEMLGGAVVDTTRRSLAGVFAQHFHEPSLGELPAQ
jgi:hypothetical protein